MSRGRLIVLSAPSGAGKTTLSNRMRAAHPEWVFSISATTREPRDHEINGADYIFLSNERFDAYIEEGWFVEWEEVHGHRYGTLKNTIEENLVAGHTVILDVDVKGGVNIKKHFRDDTIAIFVDVPDRETLVARLNNRGTEDAATIQKRLARYPIEIGYKDEYDHVIINDDLERATEELETIIRNA